MKKIFLLLISFHSVLCFSQDEQSENTEISDQLEIEQIIDEFFIALSSSDTSSLKAMCIDNVVLGTTFTARDGNPMYLEDDFNEFLKSVGTPHEETWEERIFGLEIKLKDNLAHAWMNYSFYVADNFSHCGVNSFQFVRTIDGWKIQSIIDTRSKTNCDQ